MNRKLSLACIIVVALALASTSFAASTVVIGKATIKKGTELVVMVVLPNGQPATGIVETFEDQVLYIIKKISAKPGEHRGGYMADGEGFVHNCHTHGRELIGKCLVIIPIEAVEDGHVSVKLF